ncbi:hypothetical protein BpHYR1_013826 [Brachionus plicatilis]|uniref:Uncharacterized protein n=1 Tax=Brachionus plicatilis TaxID=10195 RepID=A0A3M7SX91_BRAPC|nr:hypothetical protein BpHYR1_013826 [Brachionus plicatilis]
MIPVFFTVTTPIATAQSLKPLSLRKTPRIKWADFNSRWSVMRALKPKIQKLFHALSRKGLHLFGN